MSVWYSVKFLEASKWYNLENVGKRSENWDLCPAIQADFFP